MRKYSQYRPTVRIGVLAVAVYFGCTERGQKTVIYRICVTIIRTKNYQNLVIGFQVTVKNVRDAFLGHSVVLNCLPTKHDIISLIKATEQNSA